MKAKIQFFTRDIISVIFPLFVALILGVSFYSCQEDEFSLREGIFLKSSALPYEDPVLYWGHQTFTRIEGKPITETVIISGTDLVNFEDCLHLKIKSREDKLHLVKNAVIKIDGEQIVFPGDFNNTSSVITREICGKTEDFTLEVELRSEPGSNIEVWIEGIMKNPVVDTRDGNIYHWVKIGTQRWMVENLAYLPEIHHPSNSSVTEKRYYVYGYTGTDVNEAKDTENYARYGVLYNWPAAVNGVDTSSTVPSGVRGACPEGWHLPSYKEWMILRDFLFENGYGYGENNYIGKSLADTTDWLFCETPGAPGNDPATNNSSGFSALPAGTCHTSEQWDYFAMIGEVAQWWSSTEGDRNENGSVIWYMGRTLYYDYGKLLSHYAVGYLGMSVRCIRNY
jgi:uncharacterized protein (TIGR02145 family)